MVAAPLETLHTELQHESCRTHVSVRVFCLTDIDLWRYSIETIKCEKNHVFKELILISGI